MQSLKSRTRNKRTAGNEVKYKITGTFDISNISLKQLLAHIETKKDLTESLASKVSDFQSPTRKLQKPTLQTTKKQTQYFS